MSPAALPLAGVRIVEISSFVADYHRWPMTAGGESIHWAGLNKGKQSMEPWIGTYPAPGLPMSVNGSHTVAAPAPRLGQDNDTLPAEWLGA